MSDQVRYLRLTDYDNRGKIVRQVGFSFFVYENTSWNRIASIPYFYPDAPEYECFDEITEEEVRSIIGDAIDNMQPQTATQGKLGEYFADEDECFEMCSNMTVPRGIDKIKDII